MAVNVAVTVAQKLITNDRTTGGAHRNVSVSALLKQIQKRDEYHMMET